MEKIIMGECLKQKTAGDQSGHFSVLVSATEKAGANESEKASCCVVEQWGWGSR